MPNQHNVISAEYESPGDRRIPCQRGGGPDHFTTARFAAAMFHFPVSLTAAFFLTCLSLYSTLDMGCCVGVFEGVPRRRHGEAQVALLLGS
ncbi:unnamed protein product [Boreogadus saida]